MSRLISLLLLVLVLTGCGTSRRSQPVTPRTSTSSYDQYIDRFAPLAISHSRRYKIPASITLAQGLLESGAGNSRLARNAHNHFGIKCGRNWRGGRTYHDDDRPQECFRSYDTPEQSYQDHSLFLQQPRYASLFRLDPKDYKGWAKGLQQAGYATDKGYANKLIKIIEEHKLYLIDRGDLKRRYAYNNSSTPPASEPKATPKIKPSPQPVSSPATEIRPTFTAQGLLYIIANGHDTLASIAREMGLNERRLTSYNDFPAGYPLSEGDIVYLQKKRTRALPPHYEHTVKVGESIHSIAQRYGLRLSSLYRLNGLTPDYTPTEGDTLRLR